MLSDFSLCAENYRWHWYAFTTGAGSSLWLLLYGLFYMGSRLSLDGFTSVVLYLGYLFVPSPSHSSNPLLFTGLEGLTNSRLWGFSFSTFVLLGFFNRLLLCLANFLISGSIGFIASYVAIRKLYGAPPPLLLSLRARLS